MVVGDDFSVKDPTTMEEWSKAMDQARKTKDTARSRALFKMKSKMKKGATSNSQAVSADAGGSGSTSLYEAKTAVDSEASALAGVSPLVVSAKEVSAGEAAARETLTNTLLAFKKVRLAGGNGSTASWRSCEYTAIQAAQIQKGCCSFCERR